MTAGPRNGRFADQAAVGLEAGKDALSGGRNAQARRHFQSVQSITPAHPGAVRLTGTAAEKQGDIIAAIRQYRRVRYLNPGETAYWPRYAECLIRARLLTEAHATARQILVAHPDSISGVKILARLLSLSGQGEAVTRVLSHGHRLSPSDPSIVIGMARSAMSRGDLYVAERWCRAALDRTGPVAERFFDLARVLRASGKFDEAAEMFREAVALDPALGPAVDIINGTATDADFQVTDPAEITSF